MTAHEAFRRALEEARKICESSATMQLAENRISAIPNPYPASEWVKVSERLPNDGRSVLVYAAIDCLCFTTTGYVESGEWFLNWVQEIGEPDLVPTYWMPLPTPPEEKP